LTIADFGVEHIVDPFGRPVVEGHQSSTSEMTDQNTVREVQEFEAVCLACDFSSLGFFKRCHFQC
jgi:hypothetical protein